MPNHEHDERVWLSTDRPGERVTLSQPLPGVEILSARASTRHWKEAHASYTLAAVAPNQPRVLAHWWTRGHDVSTAAGGLMAIEPGEMHVTKKVSAPADFDVVKLSPSRVGEARLSAGYRGPFHFETATTDDRTVARSVRSVVALHARGADDIEVESAVAVLIDTVLLRLSETPPPLGIARERVRDFRLRRVREYLHAHTLSKPSLDLLSKEIGISKYWLCRQFRAAYGVTIGEYWSALRLAEATERLKRGAPIRAVCAELGFADDCHFSREFKRRWGCPPGSWLTLRAQNGRHKAIVTAPTTTGEATPARASVE